MSGMLTCRGSLQPASAASPTSASMMMVFRMVCSSGSTTDAEDAAERLGRIVQLVAPPAVELREGRKVPEERDLGGERRAARRHRRALEGIGVGEGDLGQGVDQPVAVQVLVRVRRA